MKKSTEINQAREWIRRLMPAPYVREGIQPGRDWLVIIGVTALVFCLSCFASVYIYLNINQGTLFSSVVSEATSTPETIKQNLLQKAIKDMQMRENTRAEFISNPSIPPDPSR